MKSKTERVNIPCYTIGDIGYLIQKLNGFEGSFCYLNLDAKSATVVIVDRKGNTKVFRHYYKPDGTADLSIKDQELKRAKLYLIGMMDMATDGNFKWETEEQ